MYHALVMLIISLQNVLSLAVTAAYDNTAL